MIDRKRALLILGFLGLALLVAACAPAAAPPAEEPSPAAGTPAPLAEEEPTPLTPTGGRVQAILERGQLVCGVNAGLPGFGFLDEATGSFSGFDVDFCRAIAAALFDDPNAVEFRPLTAEERSVALQTGEVDVLIRNTTWTSSRDGTWGNFTVTTFYDGQGMMVPAASGITTLEELEGATICVTAGTTTELNLADQFRARGIDFEPLAFEQIDAVYDTYVEERCDAVTGDRSQLIARRTVFADPLAHVILDVVMSKEPLGPAVPAGDDQWFDVVKWVVFATIQAEEYGINAANLDAFLASTNPDIRRFLGVEGDFGASALGLSNDFVVRIIRHVGNYAVIYDRNLGPATAFNLARGPNELWTNGGLLYSPPFR